MGSVFAALNQGENVTKGLKKVDKSEMTHKNPELRAGGVVSSAGGEQTCQPPLQASVIDRTASLYSSWQGPSQATEASVFPEETTQDGSRGQSLECGACCCPVIQRRLNLSADDDIMPALIGESREQPRNHHRSD